MPLPTDEEKFTYDAVALPVLSSDPAEAKPIGLGPVADGGNVIDAKVAVGPFEGPVDISLVIYAPAVSADDLFFFGQDRKLKRLSHAVREDDDEVRKEWARNGFRGNARAAKKFSRLVLWKTGVFEVNEDIFDARVKDLPSGRYTLVLTVSPANRGEDDDDEVYYRWVTQLVVPGNHR